jgi:hypothetical protein
VGVEDEIADAILGRGVGDRTQEGKAAALAVDGVLTRRERDVAPAATALPDREPDQPESVERSAGEVQFRLGELPGGLPLSFGVIFTVSAVGAIGFSSWAAYRGAFAA